MGNDMQINYPPLSGATGDAPSGGLYAAPAVAGAGGAVGYLPQSILYTGNSIQGDAPTNEVDFTYETRPSDQLSSYMAGFQQNIFSRLKTIQVKAGGSTVRTYTLNYTANRAGSSLLASITLTGSDGTSSLPPTTFSYQDNQGYSTSASSTYALPNNFVRRGSVQVSLYEGTELMDINGDGLPDIVQNISGSGQSPALTGAWLNTGSGLQQNSSWIPPIRLADMVANVVPWTKVYGLSISTVMDW